MHDSSAIEILDCLSEGRGPDATLIVRRRRRWTDSVAIVASGLATGALLAFLTLAARL